MLSYLGPTSFHFGLIISQMPIKLSSQWMEQDAIRSNIYWIPQAKSLIPSIYPNNMPKAWQAQLLILSLVTQMLFEYLKGFIKIK